jgi:hypothetical protein
MKKLRRGVVKAIFVPILLIVGGLALGLSITYFGIRFVAVWLLED